MSNVTAICLIASLMGAPDIRHEQMLEVSGVRDLALNVYHESRGEPCEGQLAMAMTTLNRVESDKFPDTIRDVVYAPSQFLWTNDDKSDEVHEDVAWGESISLAFFSKILYHHTRDLTDGAVFFHVNGLSPKWSKSHEVVKTTTIGNHTFYRYK